MSAPKKYIGMTARQRYLEWLYDGEPMSKMAAVMQELARQQAIDLGVCEDCIALYPDPITSTEARDGEEEAIMARMNEISDETKRPGSDVGALVEELRVLTTRLDAIRPLS
jgi:hypothetical protein